MSLSWWTTLEAETVDGKAKEVAVEEDRVKESAGWISGCFGMVLSWGGVWLIAM